jgi:hypothetical protein
MSIKTQAMVIGWEIGDATESFKLNASPKTAAILQACDIRIVCHQLPPTPTPTPEQKMIGEHMTMVTCYQISLDGKVIMNRLEMPRDVWNVIIGIGYGRGVL